MGATDSTIGRPSQPVTNPLEVAKANDVDHGERDECLRLLWKGTPAEYVAKLPRGIGDKAARKKGQCKDCDGYHELPAIHLDYLGHADTCRIIADVDPLWQWEPDPAFALLMGSYIVVGKDENGIDIRVGVPCVRDRDGYPVRLYIKLTVLGIARPGIGTVERGKSDPEKELLGDAIRNAAMRFGVGADLWSKAKGGGLDDQEGTYNAGQQTEPVLDPAKWFERHGWTHQAEHDEWRTETLDAIRAMSDEHKALIKTWQEANGLDWKQSVDHEVAAALDLYLDYLATSPASAPQQPATPPNQTHDTKDAGRRCDGCEQTIEADGSCGCPF